ncbi:hypothetical protein [Xenorhabdus anantnagensis]|uniref:Uncharacterized protein n=1 Tax=Xenorhabdus anantnagensis TaxID=3025875 RepID=A0ABT5LQ38_9GAMM|nr:hypothetical protein [Xenorhabdus anantnagensis]MDC9596514.1 hypothetical protein [Xenorhabdus anantnagensis]
MQIKLWVTLYLSRWGMYHSEIVTVSFFIKDSMKPMPFKRIFIYGPIMTLRYSGKFPDKNPQCISGTLFTPPIIIPANTTPTIKVVLTIRANKEFHTYIHIPT